MISKTLYFLEIVRSSIPLLYRVSLALLEFIFYFYVVHRVFKIQYFYFRIFRNSRQHQNSEKMRNESKIVMRVILALLFIRSPLPLRFHFREEAKLLVGKITVLSHEMVLFISIYMVWSIELQTNKNASWNSAKLFACVKGSKGFNVQLRQWLIFLVFPKQRLRNCEGAKEILDGLTENWRETHKIGRKFCLKEIDSYFFTVSSRKISK